MFRSSMPVALIWPPPVRVAIRTVEDDGDVTIRSSANVEAEITRKSVPAPPRISGSVVVAGIVARIRSSPPPAFMVSAPPRPSISSPASPVELSAVVSPSP
jgi:hypothetical protein